MALPDLSPRQRLTLLAHLFKAVAKQHHRELRPLFAGHIPADGVVIDAGAHAGQFTKLFAALAPEGRVYAFEPGGYARYILETAVRWRRLANVTVVPAGLSDAGGAAELALPVKASGSLGFGLAHLGTDDGRRPVRRETVPLTTLDDFVRETDIDRLDFIKVDLEGWEVRLLLGARQSLARFRPVLLVELVEVHLARAGNRAQQAWEILAPLGYRARKLGAAELAVDGFAGDADYLFVPGEA
jgi:FkbM family methyltransferase